MEFSDESYVHVRGTLNRKGVLLTRSGFETGFYSSSLVVHVDLVAMWTFPPPFKWGEWKQTFPM